MSSNDNIDSTNGAMKLLVKLKKSSKPKVQMLDIASTSIPTVLSNFK